MTRSLAYLDTSAAVKLVVQEPESATLARWLAAWPRWGSSEILLVELPCVAQRLRAEPLKADRVLRRTQIVAFSAAVRDRAAAPFSPPQRALDAIHLATALHLDLPELVFVSYDEQQLAAAAADGLTCASPR